MARQKMLEMKVDHGPVPEKTLRRQIMQTLGLLGYVVQEVGSERPRVRCPQCGSWHTPTGWIGNSVGVSDLVVSRPAWGGLWIHLELKGQRTRVTPEQQALADAGLNHLVRSIAAAIDAVQEAEQRLGLVNDQIAAFWASNPRQRFE